MRSFIFKIGALALCLSIITFSLSGYSIIDIVIRSFIIFVSVIIFASFVVITIMYYTQKIKKEDEGKLKEIIEQERGKNFDQNRSVPPSPVEEKIEDKTKEKIEDKNETIEQEDESPISKETL
jgi:predicted Holliday junction resolvase-like endonuclease